jgi:hypothetical protein
MSDPTSVKIVLEPREIPEQYVEQWRDDWDQETLSSLKEKFHDVPDSEEEYIELRAIEWVQDMFMNAQGHNDVHRWIDEYEVNY